MTQQISMDKKYKTRDGRDVRILCVDAARKQPVIGLIANGEVTTWSIDGSFHPIRGNASEYDLVEVKPERTMYLNIYTDGCANHLTREQADRGATGGRRVACVKVTYREGQFDE